MKSNQDIILITLSFIVLMSHFFNSVARKLSVPSVVLLIGFGMLLKGISGYFGVEAMNIGPYVPFLGTVGLILIVLEGSLDLKIHRDNLAIIRGAFGAALVILIISTWSIAWLLQLRYGVDLRVALANAIPLAVISSAIAIPTVEHFVKHKKEFLTYESVFSDVVGIMLFNLVITPGILDVSAYQGFFNRFILGLLIAAAAPVLLFWSIQNMKTQAKFFIIMSLLVFIYALGHVFHLPSLLIVFTFGLFLCNFGFIQRIKPLNKITGQENLDPFLQQFKLMVSESAFLIRTFFFVAFGYSLHWGHVLNWGVVETGAAIVLVLYLVRYFYLRFIVKTHVFPEIFIAPKGLVTILLFYGIPSFLRINGFGEGEMFFVIITTSLLMIVASFSKKHLKEDLV